MPEKQFLKELGERVKDLRIQKNLSQIDLALLCKFEKATMSRIESGKTNITVLTLRKIGGAIGTSLKDFF
jgi:transcriptional regulator with XRE-family HTH domain